MARIMVRPTKNRVFVDIFDRGETIIGGIIVGDDDFTERGVRPRRARVLAVGPDVSDVAVGEEVLVPHGDWTRHFIVPLDDGTTMKAWATEEDRILTVIG